LLAAGCAFVIVTRAADGVRTTDSLSSQAYVRKATADYAFYECVSEEARKLFPAGSSVSVATGTSNGVSLLSAVIPWADVAPDAARASLVLDLVPGHGPGACEGLVVAATPGGAK